MLLASHITKTIDGHNILDDVNITLDDGDIVGFIGNNGAGKTTTMRVLMGLSTFDKGEVTFNGAPLDHSITSTFGYMPEERGLYKKEKLLKQLKYFGMLHGLTKREAIDRSLEALTDLGLYKYRNEKLETLSLGNQQRVQLAATILHKPPVLILDEPFSGLDPSAVVKMMKLIVSQAENGSSVLFSTHQLDLIEKIATKVVMIKGGRTYDSEYGSALPTKSGHYDVVMSDVSWLADDPRLLSVGRNGHCVIRLSNDTELAEFVSQAVDQCTLYSIRDKSISLESAFFDAKKQI